MNVIKRRGEMLDPVGRGMTPARRKMIHDHRKKADLYGPELPIQFGDPKSKIGKAARSFDVECECGRVLYVSKHTYMVACPDCGKLNVVSNHDR